MTPKRIALISGIVAILGGAGFAFIPYLVLEKVDAAVRGALAMEFFIVAIPLFMSTVGVLTIFGWLSDRSPRPLTRTRRK